MRAPLQWLQRIALAVCQVLVFFVATGFGSMGASYLLATSYGPGAVPRGDFPVLAVMPAEPGAKAPNYRALRWHQIDAERGKTPALSFRLPEREGRVVVGANSTYEHAVRFRVIEESAGEQLIDILWNDDDYEMQSRYRTDGRSLRPLYLRNWGFGSMIAAFLPALLLAWLVGWWVRRRWPAAWHR